MFPIADTFTGKPLSDRAWAETTNADGNHFTKSLKSRATARLIRFCRPTMNLPTTKHGIKANLDLSTLERQNDTVAIQNTVARAWQSRPATFQQKLGVNPYQVWVHRFSTDSHTGLAGRTRRTTFLASTPVMEPNRPPRIDGATSRWRRWADGNIKYLGLVDCRPPAGYAAVWAHGRTHVRHFSMP